MYEVVLRQSLTPCASWVIELHRMGGRLPIRSEPSYCRAAALAYASELATFLRVPLVVRPTVERAEKGQTTC